MRRTFCAAAIVLLLAGAGNASAEDQSVKLVGTFGLGYSNGDYGTTRNTDVLVALSTLGASIGNFQFDLSIPYMRISGRGLVVFDAAGNPIVINRRTTVPADVRTGYGDLNLSATYTIPRSVLDDFEVRLTGRVKVPTASESKRLSTGQADFGMSVDVSRTFGFWGPFVTVGYLVPGQPSTFSLYNTVSVSTGTSIELDDNLVAIVSYDYDSASTPLVASSQELFGSLSWIFNDKITMTGYGSTGLSSGSPDIGGGLLVSYGIN